MFIYHLIDDYLTHVKVSSYMWGSMFGGGD